ncbi:MAG: Tyrosine recombinase XerC [Clostridium sp.]|jgi:integrase
MPKKRNTKRQDGRIAVQVYLGRVDGKRRYKTVYGKTQKEADEKALQVKLAMKKGIDVTAENDTFGQWAERFQSAKATDGLSVSQMNSYKNYCNILSPLNNLPISKVRTSDIQNIINNLADTNPHTGRPTSKKTLIALKGTAKQIFGMAINARVIEYNPADAVKIPRNAPQSQRRALTEEEQQWIIDTPHRAQRAAMIMMYAGLRRGEVIALTWNDVDLKKKTIRVNKAVEMIKGKPHIKPPKTKAGNRTIDIPQRLVDFLVPLRKADFAQFPNVKPINLLVCRTANGKMFTNQAWRTMWQSYLTDLNVKYGYQNRVKKFAANKRIGKKGKQGKLPMLIPNITPHWLRHTFATLLYLAGVDVLTARDQLGHADIKTTLAIYTHLDKIYKRKSMNRLDNYLDPTNRKNNECKSDASQ